MVSQNEIKCVLRYSIYFGRLLHSQEYRVILKEWNSGLTERSPTVLPSTIQIRELKLSMLQFYCRSTVGNNLQKRRRIYLAPLDQSTSTIIRRR